MSTEYPLITGQAKFEEQPPIRNNWNATTGNTLTRVWKGPTAILQNFLDNELPAGYIERDIDILATGFTVVQATYGVLLVNGVDATPDPLLTRWSMAGGMDQKHLVEHPKAYALNVKNKQWVRHIEREARWYDEQVRDAVRRGVAVPTLAAKTWSEYVGTWSEGSYFPPETGSPDWILRNNANNLYFALCRNLDASYQQPTYILKKTQVMTQTTQQIVAYQYVGCVLSHAALLESEPTLSTPPYSPDVVLLGLSGLSTMKWHKQSPTVEQVARGKYELTQEYIGVYEYDAYAYDYLAVWP